MIQHRGGIWGQGECCAQVSVVFVVEFNTFIPTQEPVALDISRPMSPKVMSSATDDGTRHGMFMSLRFNSLW